MTVKELIEQLKQMPQDAVVLAEGENADKVVLEVCISIIFAICVASDLNMFFCHTK